MDQFKHFSHIHGLVFHQTPHGSQIHCSACKSPGSGNVYVCWQCSFFLHEQCFHAPRSLNHPSHPLHPLSLVPLPTYPSGSFFCNTCSLAGDGMSYSCSHCEFDLHVYCALVPNQPQNPMYHPTSTYPELNAPPQPYVAPINVPTTNATASNSQSQYPMYALPAYPAPPQNYVNPIDVASTNATSTNSPPENPVYASPAYPQSNAPPPQNYVPPINVPTTNATATTYSTVVNTTTTNPPPPPQPQPQPSQLPSVSQSKIIKHFSHPHVLKAMEIEKKNAKICSACECELSGAAYCCTESYCTFNLHKTCFDSPREVRHKSHLEHPLTLVAAPPYSDGFTCNACLKDGKAFAYTYSACSYDLHVDCVQWPETVARPDHKHTLSLYYSSPAAEASQEVAFMCDVCKNPVHEMAWVYYCRECDFGTHLECVASGIKQENVGEGKSEEELIMETELKFAVLQLLLGAQGRKAALELI